MRIVALVLTGILFSMTGQAAQDYPPSQQQQPAADLAEPAMVLR